MKNTAEIARRIVWLDDRRQRADRRGDYWNRAAANGRIQELRWVLGEKRDDEMTLP